MDNKVILFNSYSVQWTTLSYQDYELYKRCMYDNSFGLNDKAKELFIKLSVKGILNSNPKTEMQDYKNLQIPMTVYFEPTSYCNLQCVYCYAEASTARGIHYSTENTKKLLESIMNYPSVKTIVFTGGEPLLRNDCLELAEYINQRGIHPCILTNGLLINKYNVKRFKVFEKVTISLDGHTKETHEKTRGENTFYKVVEAIKLLREQDINVCVTTVISKVNQEYIVEIMDFVKDKLDVKSHNMSIHISFGKGIDSGIECSEEEVKKYRDTYFNYLCETECGNIETFLRPSIKKGEYRTGCGAGCSEIFVKDSGDVFPCRLLNDSKYYLGNLTNLTLSEIVKSKELETIKDSFNTTQIKSCSECSYKNICGGGCRSVHSSYTGSTQKSSKILCNMLKNEIDSAIIIQNGFNPMTKKEIK